METTKPNPVKNQHPLDAMIERVRDVIRRQHKSYSTEKTYCGWIVRYWWFCTKLDRSLAPEQKMEAFLTMLARQGGVSAATQSQAFNATLFLYRAVLGTPLGDISALRATRPVYARPAPSRDEVVAVLRHIPDSATVPARLVVSLLYGAGLRVNEALDLRIKDIRLADSRLVIRAPKHGHDRLVPIPCSLVGALRAQIEHARHVFGLDQQATPPLPLEIPFALARKYPRAPHSFGWMFLFPSLGPQRHPRTGASLRWHLRDREVQRAVRTACARAGIDTPITPHCFRHGFGTHFRGDIRDLQEILGHKSLETTQLYRHPEIDRATSPLDELPALVPHYAA